VAAQRVEHDPEKWYRFSRATNAERVCTEIVLKRETDRRA
jgi:hypothetical protein